jgi:hypothetical protein
MSFSFSKFSHISHQWDSNLKCHIIFSLYFPIGFKEVLMAYTHRLVSPQDFSHRVLEEFYKTIIQRWLKKNYIKIPRSNWSKESVMKYWLVINWHNYVIRGIIKDVIRKLQPPCRRVIPKGCSTPQGVPTQPFPMYIFRGPPLNQFICIHFTTTLFQREQYGALY